MSTTNYDWSVPINGGSVDTWGLIINATLEDVDNVVFTNAGLAAQKAANLSDLANVATARANIGANNASNLSTGTIPSGRVSGSYTGITGTGALNAGSITSGFGNINIGSSTFTGNGSGITSLPIVGGTTGTLSIARGGTGITSFGSGVQSALGSNSTGSGGLVRATSPSLTTPNIGTPSAGNLSNCDNLPIGGGTTGTLAVNRGGTGSTSASGARSNLGLGTAATQNTGTSGGNVPLLNGNNTYSGNATFTGSNFTVGTTIARSGQGGHIYHNNSARSSGAITVSTSTPSGGSNGDIWLQVP